MESGARGHSWLAMSAAYAWMLSLGAKFCLSPKIRRAAMGWNPDSVNAFRLGPPPFQNRYWIGGESHARWIC